MSDRKTVIDNIVNTYGPLESGRSARMEEMLNTVFQNEHNQAHSEGFEKGIEAAAKVCEDQQQVFLSPQYATGQPMSSVGERIGCAACADEIRALKEKTNDT